MAYVFFFSFGPSISNIPTRHFTNKTKLNIDYSVPVGSESIVYTNDHKLTKIILKILGKINNFDISNKNHLSFRHNR